MNRVAYFAHTADISGPNNSLRRLLRGLDRNEFEPVIYFPDAGPAVDELRLAGERCHILPAHQLRHAIAEYPRFAIELVRSGLRMARRLRDDNVRLVHSNTSVTPQAAVAALCARVPFVCHVRESLRRSRVNDLYFRLVLRSASRIIAVSRSVRDDVLRRTRVKPGRVEVIYNGLDLADFDRRRLMPIEHGPFVPAGATVVALPAFFLSHKGHEVLLAAASSLIHRDRLNVVVWLIGHEAPEDGDRFTRHLNACCETYRIADRVRFLGLRRDVPALLSAADVVCVPSTYPDPLPNAVLEGMAAGKPVVASATGGIPELLEDGKAGVLVPSGDVEALTRELARLVRDKTGREALGRVARTRVERHFTSRQYVDHVQQVYRSLQSAEE